MMLSRIANQRSASHLYIFFQTSNVGQTVRQLIAAKATSGYNGASFLNVSNSSNIFSVAKKMFVYLAMRFMDTEDQTIGNLVPACKVTNFFWTRQENISANHRLVK